MRYFLPKGYQHRDEPAYYLDDVPQATGITWQPDVYWDAAALADELGAAGIVDMGCGRADKLAEVRTQHPEWAYVGVDFWDNAAWCMIHRPWLHVVDKNLEAPFDLTPEVLLHTVVVCADVVEHLRDPGPLLRSIARMLERGALAAVFSTPDRVLTWGPDHLGPPPNPCHVREWALDEFVALLESFHLPVVEARHTRSDDHRAEQHTIYAVVRPAPKEHPA